jgi:hypothetical protein
MPPLKTKAAAPVRQPYLKSKNAVYLWTFIGANLAIFLSLFVSKGFTSSSVDHFWQRVTTKDGIIAASLPILAIVLAGVLNDAGKARLVFWHWHNPLPGCRAFTQLITTDPRIDVPALKAKLGELQRRCDDFRSAQGLFAYERHGLHRRSIHSAVHNWCSRCLAKLEDRGAIRGRTHYTIFTDSQGGAELRNAFRFERLIRRIAVNVTAYAGK